jgi:hypothetical protein
MVGCFFCYLRDTPTALFIPIIVACHPAYILLKYQPKLQALTVEAVKGQKGLALCKTAQNLPEIRRD